MGKADTLSPAPTPALWALAEEVEGQAAPLGRQVEVGEISEDAWADGYADIEERLGWPEAFQAREEARDALIAWDLAHARALWDRYGRLFPGQSLADVEALFTRRDMHRRLAGVVMRLRVDT